MNNDEMRLVTETYARWIRVNATLYDSKVTLAFDTLLGVFLDLLRKHPGHLVGTPRFYVSPGEYSKETHGYVAVVGIKWYMAKPMEGL